MTLLQRTPHLMIEPREEQVLDLMSVLAGQPKLVPVINWYARSAGCDGEHVLSAAGVEALGRISPTRPISRKQLEDRFGEQVVNALVAAKLLVEPPGSDAQEPESNWHPLAAIAHRHLRWRGVDSESATAALQEATPDILDRLGPPPPVALELCPASERVALPQSGERAALDDLVARRATGRNFDGVRALPVETFGQMMQRVYGALALSHTSGVPVIKRATASAGGLHAVEAYVLVQNVERLQPGLYHYHPVDHALQPTLALDAAGARSLATRFVANQSWFVDAPVMVVLVARFERNFWKYRRHAKTHRALILDAGHLSHHQYLVATELGLAAFITAAINEGDIEDAFGLDPMQEGVIAVTGFGWRGERMEVLEFDPQRQVWPDWTPDPA
jgi:putative peptide maturation dehydrogenase